MKKLIALLLTIALLMGLAIAPASAESKGKILWLSNLNSGVQYEFYVAYWKMIAENLDTDYLPDPDLLIRTCNEQRISNFLLWQCAYTEFYYTPVAWPDVNKEELIKATWVAGIYPSIKLVWSRCT